MLLYPRLVIFGLWALALEWVVAANTQTVSAQAHKVIPVAPACNKCQVTQQLVVTLGKTDGSPGELVRPLNRVDVDRRGRYFVTTEGELIAVYDSAGGFLFRLGREGKGPAEFVVPRVLAIANDSLFIGDIVNSRLSILDLRRVDSVPATFKVPEFARGMTQDLRLPGGQLVSHIITLRREDIGYPLHLFTSDGRKTKSFGTSAPAFRPDRPRLLARRLAPSRSRGLWAGHFLAAIVEEYDSTGNLVRTLDLQAPWFPPGDGSAKSPVPDGPTPAPRLSALFQDKAGLLWIAISVADRRWREAFSNPIPSRTAPSGFLYTVDDVNILFDSVVLVVDVNKNLVLAEKRFDQEIVWFDRSTGLAAVNVLEGSGSHRVQVWRLELQQP